MDKKVSEKGIRIEKIEKRDIEKAHQFCLSVFEEMGWDKKFAYSLENLKEFFSKPREVFLLAKEKERIIACAGLKALSEREGLLKRFYVAEDFRGRGLAGLMFNKIKEFAKEQNYKTIVLDIFQDNLRAKRFFQRQGFSVFNPAPNEFWPESKETETFEFRKLELKYD